MSREQEVEEDETGQYVRTGEILGVGAFKTVYKAIDRDKGIEVAWNSIKLDRIHFDFEKLYQEVQLLEQLSHPHIIEFYHSWINQKKKEIVFITECMTSGTLRQFIKKAKNVKVKVIKGWCKQILSGLEYLHTRNPPIIHRDIKCDNIFINGSVGEVKIGDLGLATVMKRDNALSIIGTPEFMAPEFYDEKYTEKVDIWAFGMCVLEMATLDYPYSECENPAQIFKKVSAGLKPAGLARITDDSLREFIEICLADQEVRPSAKELLAHPFLDWESSSNDRNNTPVDALVTGAPAAAAAPADKGVSTQKQGSMVQVVIPLQDGPAAAAAPANPEPPPEAPPGTLSVPPPSEPTHSHSTDTDQELSECYSMDGHDKSDGATTKKEAEEACKDIDINVVSADGNAVQLQLTFQFQGEAKEAVFGFDLMHDSAYKVANEVISTTEIPQCLSEEVTQQIQQQVYQVIQSKPTEEEGEAKQSASATPIASATPALPSSPTTAPASTRTPSSPRAAAAGAPPPSLHTLPVLEPVLPAPAQISSPALTATSSTASFPGGAPASTPIPVPSALPAVASSAPAPASSVATPPAASSQPPSMSSSVSALPAMPSALTEVVRAEGTSVEDEALPDEASVKDPSCAPLPDNENVLTQTNVQQSSSDPLVPAAMNGPADGPNGFSHDAGIMSDDMILRATQYSDSEIGKSHAEDDDDVYIKELARKMKEERARLKMQHNIELQRLKQERKARSSGGPDSHAGSAGPTPGRSERTSPASPVCGSRVDIVGQVVSATQSNPTLPMKAPPVSQANAAAAAHMHTTQPMLVSQPNRSSGRASGDYSAIASVALGNSPQESFFQQQQQYQQQQQQQQQYQQLLQLQHQQHHNTMPTPLSAQQIHQGTYGMTPQGQFAGSSVSTAANYPNPLTHQSSYKALTSQGTQENISPAQTAKNKNQKHDPMETARKMDELAMMSLEMFKCDPPLPKMAGASTACGSSGAPGGGLGGKMNSRSVSLPPASQCTATNTAQVNKDELFPLESFLSTAKLSPPPSLGLLGGMEQGLKRPSVSMAPSSTMPTFYPAMQPQFSGTLPAVVSNASRPVHSPPVSLQGWPDSAPTSGSLL